MSDEAVIAEITTAATVPEPVIELLEFTLAAPVLVIRPFCANEHYWQVYFDTNRMIRNTFGQAGFPAPEQHYAVRGKMEGEAARSAKAVA